MNPKIIRYDPKEVNAIADWLSLMIRNDPDMKLILHIDGKEVEATKGHVINILYSAFKELEIARKVEVFYELAGRLQSAKLLMEKKTSDMLKEWNISKGGIPWHILQKGNPHKEHDHEEWRVPNETFNYLSGCAVIVQAMEESWRFCKKSLEKFLPKRKSFRYDTLRETINGVGCPLATDKGVENLWK